MEGADGADDSFDSEQADEPPDTYDVETWEPRTVVDRFSVGLYRALSAVGRTTVVLVAALFLLVELISVAIALGSRPTLAVFFLLSFLPAVALAGYVWYAEPTTREPVSLLVVTVVAGLLFANFAAVVNTTALGILQALGLTTGLLALVGFILFFYLVVGPVEEFVKWLAVRLFAYRDARFDSAVDGAVYGAMAGLGFALIENVGYVVTTTGMFTATGQFVTGPNFLTAALSVSTVRGIVGPGHVLWSAISGYYLGLAKLNPGERGPIVVKGLFIASVVHSTYNTTVGIVPATAATISGVGDVFWTVAYILIYLGVVGYYLLAKFRRHREVYRVRYEKGGL